MRYHFYLASGPENEMDGTKDKTIEFTDLDKAITAFKKAIDDGHEYACLELLRDKPIS